jgi:chaperonin cofactor prefoldin
MINPSGIREELNELSNELDGLSKTLGAVEAELESVEMQYEEWMSSFEEGLWTNHVDLGAKFPPEALRTRLGHLKMDPSLLGRYTGLVKRRKRIEKRIATLGKVVDSKRSVLSALKAELEATR